jgi:hypothetical protein
MREGLWPESMYGSERFSLALMAEMRQRGEEGNQDVKLAGSLRSCAGFSVSPLGSNRVWAAGSLEEKLQRIGGGQSCTMVLWVQREFRIHHP